MGASVANYGAEDSKGNVPMTCTIIVAVPKNSLAQHVALTMRNHLRPKVYDFSKGGYRELKFDVVEQGKEVILTVHGVSGSDATTVWGQMSDELYSRQLTCTFKAPQAQAA